METNQGILAPEFWGDCVEKFIREKRYKRRLNERGEKEYRYVLAMKCQAARRYRGRHPSLRVYNWLLKHHITNPVQDDLERYFQYLQQKGVSLKTVNKILYISRAFFRFLDERTIYQSDIKHIKAFRLSGTAEIHERGYISPALFFELLAVIDDSKLIGVRDRVILKTAYMTGARLGAIVSLRRKHFVYDSRKKAYRLKFDKLKRRKLAETDFIPNVVSDAIKEYLKRVKREGITLKPDSYLFFGLSSTRHGQPLTVPGLSMIVKNHLRQLVKRGVINEDELQTLCAHSLKHGYMSLILSQREFSIPDAQRLGKHKSKNSIFRYVHTLKAGHLFEKVDTLFSNLQKQYGLSENAKAARKL